MWRAWYQWVIFSKPEWQWPGILLFVISDVGGPSLNVRTAQHTVAVFVCLWSYHSEMTSSLVYFTQIQTNCFDMWSLEQCTFEVPWVNSDGDQRHTETHKKWFPWKVGAKPRHLSSNAPLLVRLCSSKDRDVHSCPDLRSSSRHLVGFICRWSRSIGHNRKNSRIVKWDQIKMHNKVHGTVQHVTKWLNMILSWFYVMCEGIMNNQLAY